MIRVLAFLLPLLFSFSAVALEPEVIESIKSSLREVLRADQEPRIAISEKEERLGYNHPDVQRLLEELEETDVENQQIVADILERYGWPDKNDFGSIGPGETVFLVIQHADIEFQRRYFAMAEEAAEKGNLRKSSLALLQDRMLIRDGHKQLYGSQVRFDQETGEPSFYPIEDEENVDVRRHDIGLEPLADYARRFGFEYSYR